VYVRKIPVVPYNDEKEWLWYCTKIIENFNFLVRSEIEGIRIRSSFGRLCVWTEYDQLKMGVINLQKFTEKGLELLLLFTKGLGVGWCVKVNLKIQECILDLMCYRKSLFFENHACLQRSSCKCVLHLISDISNVVQEKIYMKNKGYLIKKNEGFINALARTSFVKIQMSLSREIHYRPIHLWRAIWMTVAMSLHKRLGRHSKLKILNCDLITMIYDMVIVHNI
jgi:hypothetical protein